MWWHKHWILEQHQTLHQFNNLKWMLTLDVTSNRISVTEHTDRKINHWMNLRIEEWALVTKNIKKERKMKKPRNGLLQPKYKKKGKWNRHLLVWMKPLRISLSNAISWQSEWCLGVLALTDSGLIRIVACYLHFFTTFQVWTIMILKKLTNKNIHDYHLSCCCWFYLFFFFF